MIPGAIVQARTGSTRLPGKILKELPYGSGITVLEQVIRRLQRCREFSAVIIATTTAPEDDAVVKVAESCGAAWFRGSSEDVLARYHGAAVRFGIDPVVRVTSDCPCIDPGVVDRCVAEFHKRGVDYLSNTLRRTFPHGLDVEVFSFNALDTAHREARAKPEREHVTPFIIQSEERFSRVLVEANEDETGPNVRVTLDTDEDYALLCVVFDALYDGTPFFGAKAITRLFKEKPYLHLINRRVVQKKIFGSLEEEYEEAIRVLELQDLHRMVAYLRDGRTRLKSKR